MISTKSVRMTCLILVVLLSSITSIGVVTAEPLSEQKVLFVIVRGSPYDYLGYAINMYQTLVDTGASATRVDLDTNGKVADLISSNDYDQIWVWDLSPSSDNYQSDWQAIADWYNSSTSKNIITDGRVLSSYSYPRNIDEGRRLTENYYYNLKVRGGGLLLGTDHTPYQIGINETNKLIGLNPFLGVFSLSNIPIDTQNPLMNTPNDMGTQLYADSSPGQTPYGLQPNGQILYSVAWLSGNPDTPGISSTIEGSIGLHTKITSPSDNSLFCNEIIMFEAEATGGNSPYTYEWSSNITGNLGSNPTLQIDSNSLSSGTHIITVVTRDSQSRIDNDQVKITVNYPPITKITMGGTEGLNGWYTSDVQLTLTSTDDDSGISSTEYSFDNTNWITYTDPFTISTEGTNIIYYRSTDSAGGVETTQTEEINIDKTLPTISGAAATLPNVNGWYNTDVVVQYTASDTGSGIDTVTPDTTISTEGAAQNIVGTATDKAGNSASVTVSGINIDKTLPSISITTPVNYGLYMKGEQMSFSATDETNDIANVAGTLTSTIDGASTVSSPFSPDTGVYTLTVTAEDNAGNTVIGDPVFFVVYDPDGGHATGGGWFYPDSESSLSGDYKATFGFVAKYKTGSSTGNLEFQYHDPVNDINLKSNTIDWLTINEVSAIFQGTGTINSEEGYTFRVTAKDSGKPGNGDYFDIKIWDNPDTETLEPIHKAKNYLEGGNIIVHKK